MGKRLCSDSGTEGTPGESKNLGQKENGNYIMYARATSVDKLNNNKFSLCSIRNISQFFEKKRNNCFVESGQPICGNGVAFRMNRYLIKMYRWKTSI